MIRVLLAAALCVLAQAEGCRPPPQAPVEQHTEEPARMVVVSEQAARCGTLGALYNVIVLRDSKTGKEYLCVERCGVAKMDDE